MTSETQKRIYEINRQIVMGEKYAEIVRECKESLEELQITAQSFTKEQWDAFHRYQDALMIFYDIMLQLALEDVPPAGQAPAGNNEQ